MAQLSGAATQLFRDDYHTVKCWGSNANGHLGLGDTSSRGISAGQMGDALPSVPLGTGRSATAIACGYDWCCASLDDGTVKCWGVHSVGEFGPGNTAARGSGAGQMGDSLPFVALW